MKIVNYLEHETFGENRARGVLWGRLLSGHCLADWIWYWWVQLHGQLIQHQNTKFTVSICYFNMISFNSLEFYWQKRIQLAPENTFIPVLPVVTGMDHIGSLRLLVAPWVGHGSEGHGKVYTTIRKWLSVFMITWYGYTIFCEASGNNDEWKVEQ